MQRLFVDFGCIVGRIWLHTRIPKCLVHWKLCIIRLGFYMLLKLKKKFVVGKAGNISFIHWQKLQKKLSNHCFKSTAFISLICPSNIQKQTNRKGNRYKSTQNFSSTSLFPAKLHASNFVYERKKYKWEFSVTSILIGSKYPEGETVNKIAFHRREFKLKRAK